MIGPLLKAGAAIIGAIIAANEENVKGRPLFRSERPFLLL